MAVHSISDIQKIVSDLARQYGAERVYLFGSYARGDMTAGSDIDLRTDKGSIRGLAFAGLLGDRGFKAECLNGDMRQRERNQIMADFRAEKIDILVATDVAARGIDVSDVDAVVNYEIPMENEYYIHRIGRTGRAKKEGVSYVFFAPDERKRLDTILHYTRSNVTELEFNEQGELVEKQA